MIVRFGAAACFTLVALAMLGSESEAYAADKAACAAAAEVGQRLKKEHKLLGAREQLLICSSKDCPDIVSQDCTQWLGEVERSVPSVVLKPLDEHGRALDGVRVTENGVVVAEQAGEAPVEVDPGSHVFHFERASYAPADQRVQLEEGRRNQEIVVTMHPAAATTTTPTPTPTPTPRGEAATGTGWLGAAITATTLAVVGGGLFAGFGLSGLSDQDALKKTCAPFCTDAQTSPVQTKFTVANVALVSGLVALAAAGVFWVLWGTTHTPSKTVGASASGLVISF